MPVVEEGVQIQIRLGKALVCGVYVQVCGDNDAGAVVGAEVIPLAAFTEPVLPLGELLVALRQRGEKLELAVRLHHIDGARFRTFGVGGH